MNNSAPANARARFSVSQYDLGGTLNSGQAFRWESSVSGWEGVIGMRWVKLHAAEDFIEAEAVAPAGDWHWLTHYLQLGLDLPSVLATFPQEPPMQAAIKACFGLRLLRQEPWECLASFILSSTKQIVHIRQIVSALCARFGQGLPVPGNTAPWFSFPSAARIASCTESELRDCRMGFRAPNLLAAAEAVASGKLDLTELGRLRCDDARERLLQLRGVGRKIADCVLLFAYGFQGAFPVDVWVLKALRTLYFRNRRVKPTRLLAFTTSHFGPNAGYAQQYLFHYMRTQRRAGQAARPSPPKSIG